MRIVVISATSEIAQQCCKLWLASGTHELVLTGRNSDKLRRIASDLRVRYPESSIVERVFDHLSLHEIKSFVSKESESETDLVLIATGSLTSQKRASVDERYLWSEIQVNALSPIVFLELWSGVFEKQGHGHLAVIGSVAGDRGRAINYGYGASKAALETYTSGLQHRFVRSAIKVSLIKPGPTRTPMTLRAHIGPAKLAQPTKVAKEILRGLSKGQRVIYSPKTWRIIMFIVRAIPFTLFSRMKF